MRERCGLLRACLNGLSIVVVGDGKAGTQVHIHASAQEAGLLRTALPQCEGVNLL